MLYWYGAGGLVCSCVRDVGLFFFLNYYLYGYQDFMTKATSVKKAPAHVALKEDKAPKVINNWKLNLLRASLTLTL